ncbi:MAG: asparagine synthase (glutamine-hydrolyzing), partial [Pirellulaceae bacterium]
MCGIAGILRTDSDSPAPADVLSRMLQTIFHRGPDDEGVLLDGELAMGMRRLSIIDLAEGRQPMFDESGRFGVIFNGEIYNYRELRQELAGRGHQLRTHSDTEVIVHLYEERGAECLEQLRGMFAFAIWDKQSRELFLARDRLGVKPLYYAEHDGALLFASEIKALLQYPTLRPGMDLQALSDYLALKYVPAPRTLFAGIRSLPPGTFLRMRQGKIEQRRYWNLSFAKPSVCPSDEESEERLLELLRESVRLRLRSDVPFGAFLSGGVDSSLIVALMREQMTEPVRAFSVGFAGGSEQDELPFARQVAARFGCEHHTLTITAADWLQHAEQVLWHLDQPIADQATVATFLVARLARQHVKMVLTGEGGDELFAGYARYAGEQFSPWFRWLPPGMGSLLRRGTAYLPGLRRGKIAIQALTQADEATRFAHWFPMFTDEARSELFGARGVEAVVPAASVFSAELARCDATAPLDRMLHVDTSLWLPDYLLLRGDKLTMAHSLEARVPLLDHRLVEFAARLPVDAKLRGRTRKYLLKRVASRFLPAEIVHRRKQGFPIPIDRWLRREARPLMRDLLAPDVLRAR